MPGCTLHASGELVLVLAAGGGVHSANLPVPALPGLLGAKFFDQAFAADPGVNPAGATASNAGEGTIGVK
jgi:hypothetical protein